MRRTFIPKLHADLRAARIEKRGATARPENVPQGMFKEYPRMPRLKLPSSIPTSSLSEAFSMRSSHRKVVPRTPLSTELVGALLGGLRVRENGTRPYPSGGSLYPIETYLIGALNEHTSDVFHYQPLAHALEHLWPMPAQFTLSDLVPGVDEALGEPTAMLVFTGMWQRSASKYGDFSYILSLLEAGHMAQNVLLSAAALGVGARPMEGFSDNALHAALDIDGSSEQAVYVILLYPKQSV